MNISILATRFISIDQITSLDIVTSYGIRREYDMQLYISDWVIEWQNVKRPIEWNFI